MLFLQNGPKESSRQGVAVIIAADVGGTYTRVALFELEGALKKQEETTFRSRDYPNLLAIIQEYLSSKKVKIKSACFAVAGPIHEGRCKLTNIPDWVVDIHEFQEALKVSNVILLNDLEANAWGLGVLAPEDFVLLQKGNPRQLGNAALISPGTGLGEAGLYWDGKKFRPFACEGGHSDFAARNALEFELFTWLQKKYGHVSYERVVSGPGLGNIYHFLIESGHEKENPTIHKEMEEKDPPQVVSIWGKDQKDQACTHALEWFLSLYGAEVGNAALKFLALGGIYLGGGIVPHIVDQMKQGPFISSFLDKGRFKPLLETIPVRLILNDETALLGTAAYARRK